MDRYRCRRNSRSDNCRPCLAYYRKFSREWLQWVSDVFVRQKMVAVAPRLNHVLEHARNVDTDKVGVNARMPTRRDRFGGDTKNQFAQSVLQLRLWKWELGFVIMDGPIAGFVFFEATCLLLNEPVLCNWSWRTKEDGEFLQQVKKWVFGENYGGFLLRQLAKKLTKMMTKPIHRRIDVQRENDVRRGARPL